MKMRNGVIIALVALLIGVAAGWTLAVQTEGTAGNYTDEMKMTYRTDYADGGANTEKTIRVKTRKMKKTNRSRKSKTRRTKISKKKRNNMILIR